MKVLDGPSFGTIVVDDLKAVKYHTRAAGSMFGSGFNGIKYLQFEFILTNDKKMRSPKMWTELGIMHKGKPITVVTDRSGFDAGFN